VEPDDGVVAGVASVVGDFLFLFMSPNASAELLASATIDVRMKAGASLRMESSWT
jgi:uncharacterized protein YraI